MYRRERVLDFADKYWWRPCPDGIVWLKGRELHMAQEIASLRAKGKIKVPHEAIFLTYSTRKLEGLFVLPTAKILPAKNGAAESYPDAIMLSSFLDNPNTEPNLSALGFYPPHHGLNDCTHFTTECLIAGGFPAPPTAARQFAPSLFTHLSNHAHVRTLASEVSITEAAKVIGAGPMKTGDVIMYSTPGQPRPERHHAVIFLEAESRIAKDGQIARHAPAGITMHTWHKWREPWQDAGGGSDQLISLFHVNDEAYHAPYHQAWIGWWAINGFNSRYVYLDGTGHVTTATSAPHSTTAKPQGGTDYWFADATNMWISFRRKNMGVEVYAINPGSSPVTAVGMTSNKFMLSAVKL